MKDEREDIEVITNLVAQINALERGSRSQLAIMCTLTGLGVVWGLAKLL